MVAPDAAFWCGRRVLLTGHTGFKGAWLALWLTRLGAQVSAFALPPPGRSLYGDADVGALVEGRFMPLANAAQVSAFVRESRPEIVFHLAAQALVRPAYRDPLGTFATNVLGTANLLDALRDLDTVRVAVVVTTDKVYDNQEVFLPYRENDALGGHDPYSASKAAAELITWSYVKSFLRAQGVAVATARAGNVIGGGDWSEDRLIPDAVKAWEAGDTLHIRRPDSVRPWQHVLEPLAAYMQLATALWRDPALSGSFNFGPRTDEAADVATVVRIARDAYGRGAWVTDEPLGPHEAGWLALETAKARNLLGVRPRWLLEEAVRRTIAWYREHSRGTSARELCFADIDAFEETK